MSDIKTFGSRVYYLNKDPGKGKLDPRGLEGIFVGYSTECKAFRVWTSTKRKVIVSRDVKFIKDDKLDHIINEKFETNRPLVNDKARKK